REVVCRGRGWATISRALSVPGDTSHRNKTRLVSAARNMERISPAKRRNEPARSGKGSRTRVVRDKRPVHARIREARKKIAVRDLKKKMGERTGQLARWLPQLARKRNIPSIEANDDKQPRSDIRIIMPQDGNSVSGF